MGEGGKTLHLFLYSFKRMDVTFAYKKYLKFLYSCESFHKLKTVCAHVCGMLVHTLYSQVST